MIERTRTTFMAEGGLIEKRLGGVAVIGSLLPMLGLLGTVVGMITAFNAIAMHGTGDPKILADGISQALLTTEAGLVTSIPLLYIHHILADRADLLVQKLDTFATHALHLAPENGVSAAGN
jgi:biopolymer transport protein ExbB